MFSGTLHLIIHNISKFCLIQMPDLNLIKTVEMRTPHYSGLSQLCPRLERFYCMILCMSSHWMMWDFEGLQL